MYGADGNDFANNEDAIDDAATDINWDRDHNWQAPHHSYNDNQHAPADINSTYASMLKSENSFVRKIVRQTKSTESKTTASS